MFWNYPLLSSGETFKEAQEGLCHDLMEFMKKELDADREQNWKEERKNRFEQ